MNSAIISGTLGKPVKITELESGMKVLNNTVCVTESDNDEKFTWVNIVAYEELAKFIVENYEMDDFVIVQGRIKTRSWIDKETSEKRYITEILVFKIEGVE